MNLDDDHAVLAVLDTCVLWPSAQRDFLLSLAAESLYQPIWSDAILAELVEHERRKLVARGSHPAAAAEAAERLVGRMADVFDGSRITGWEHLDGTFGLPDVDDEHVVAAAVAGGASTIVTDNVRDFPAARIPDGIHVLRARDFAAEIVARGPSGAARAVLMMAGRYANPPIVPIELVAILEQRYGMSAAAKILRTSLM